MKAAVRFIKKQAKRKVVYWWFKESIATYTYGIAEAMEKLMNQKFMRCCIKWGSDEMETQVNIVKKDEKERKKASRRLLRQQCKNMIVRNVLKEIGRFNY